MPEDDEFTLTAYVICTVRSDGPSDGSTAVFGRCARCSTLNLNTLIGSNRIDTGRLLSTTARRTGGLGPGLGTVVRHFSRHTCSTTRTRLPTNTFGNIPCLLGSLSFCFTSRPVAVNDHDIGIIPRGSDRVIGHVGTANIGAFNGAGAPRFNLVVAARPGTRNTARGPFGGNCDSNNSSNNDTTTITDNVMPVTNTNSNNNSVHFPTT